MRRCDSQYSGIKNERNSSDGGVDGSAGMVSSLATARGRPVATDGSAATGDGCDGVEEGRWGRRGLRGGRGWRTCSVDIAHHVPVSHHASHL